MMYLGNTRALQELLIHSLFDITCYPKEGRKTKIKDEKKGDGDCIESTLTKLSKYVYFFYKLLMIYVFISYSSYI